MEHNKRIALTAALCLAAFSLMIPSPSAAYPAAQAETEETAEVPAPEAPVPQHPQGEITSGPVGFYWEPSAGADYYEIQWKNDRGEQGKLQQRASDSTCGSGRCIVYTGIPSAGSYTWTVSAVNDSGTAASEEMTFTLRAGLSAPEGYRPNRTLSSENRLTFEWEDTRDGARSFRVQAADQNSGRICLDRWFPIDGMFVGNGVCSRSTDLYLPSGAYHWRVQSSNGTTVSPWSGWTDFDIECAACAAGNYTNSVSALLYPIGASIDLSPYFAWRAVTGVQHYTLQVRDAAGSELLNVSVPPENCTLETCTYKPDIFFPAGVEYSWSVSAYGWNESLWGRAEDVFSTAVPGVMKDVSFIVPQDNGSLDPDNPEIIWSDPGEQTASFTLAVMDGVGEPLYLGELSRSEAWCDGITCSIQFRTIPEGENYRIILTPYSEYGTAGNTIALTFNNPHAEK